MSFPSAVPVPIGRVQESSGELLDIEDDDKLPEKSVHSIEPCCGSPNAECDDSDWLPTAIPDQSCKAGHCLSILFNMVVFFAEGAPPPASEIN